jgi:cell division protein FtsQ
VPRLSRPLRSLAVTAAVAALLVGGWLWFRDSSFVSVEDVSVVGVSSSEGEAVRRAIVEAARSMSTLHVREDQLRTAVRPFASVASVRAQPSFPHDMRVEVIEREPVAAVDLGGMRVPVGAGGLLMRGVRAPKDLPTVRVSRLGAEGRLSDVRALGAVGVLAAAPAELRSRIDRAWWSPRGLVLEMRDGPDVIFGHADEERRKWAAAARVLAEPSALGAAYVDVRVPERVAAGGLQPVSPATANPQPQPENTATLNP